MITLNKRIYKLLNPGKSWEEIVTEKGTDYLNGNQPFLGCSIPEIFEMFSPPLQLADVLRALVVQTRWNWSVHLLHRNKDFVCYIATPTCRIVIDWDLTKDLDQQTEETRTKLMELLK